ncbi:MAG: phosphatidate cytidylyltransferase [Betaproteobacteria bacterium]|nr:phosphatidate cytidylyltransferase [Betaproteobacteria bacterium]
MPPRLLRASMPEALAPQAPAQASMLKTRVITAVVLLAVLIPALFLLPPRGWAVLMMVAVAAAAWEWGRLCGFKTMGAVLLAVLIVASALFLLLLAPDDFDGNSRTEDAGEILLYAAALLWFLAVPVWLRWRNLLPGRAALAVLGWLLLLASWYAVWKFREAGSLYLLFMMGTVWIADIAAYVAGKNFGRHKLAPAISPGKTWEGVAGAVIGVQIYAIALLALESVAPNYFGALAARLGVTGTLAAVLVLTLVSVVGDLFESLLKRRIGMKDSSQLLPGHGGVLDRIDAQLSTLPVALALVALIARATA